MIGRRPHQTLLETPNYHYPQSFRRPTLQMHKNGQNTSRLNLGRYDVTHLDVIHMIGQNACPAAQEPW